MHTPAVLSLCIIFCTVYYATALRENICRRLDGLWVRDPRNCSVAYHCGKGGVVAQSVACNKSQIWSVLSNACVEEMDPLRDDCNGIPPVRIKDDVRCIIKNGNNPDPDDCSAFLSCSNGTMVARQKCGEGTLYLPHNDSCQFSYVVAPYCKTGSIPSHITIEKPDELCGNLMDKSVRTPDDPCSFVHCYMGRIQKTESCPPDTQFDETTDQCEWSQAPECQSSPVIRGGVERFRKFATRRAPPPTPALFRRRETTAKRKNWRRISWDQPSWVKRRRT